MSSFMGDISSLIPNQNTTKVNSTNKKAGSTDLGMADFLSIMVAQFQNQDPENAADTSDMLNQLMQMTVIQAVTDVTDAATMLYSSSLVGKEVTIGEYDSSGRLQEIVGTVTATGTYGGQPVVFIGDKSYYLSSIMAVGQLPDPNAKPAPVDPPPTDTENPDDPDLEPTAPGENGGDDSGDGGENGAVG